MTDKAKARTVLWASELLRSLVFEYRIVTLDYFLNELSIHQAYLCVDNLKYTDISLKILTRYAIWSMYNSNGWVKNNNAVEDILHLPWDEKEDKHIIATKEEVKEQKSRLKDMEELMKNATVIEEKFI